MSTAQPEEANMGDQTLPLGEDEGVFGGEGRDDRLDDVVEPSSEISALTDEQEELERERREREAVERAQREENNRKTQQNLNRVLLNASKKKYLYLISNGEVNYELSVLWNTIRKNSISAADYEKVEELFHLVFKLLLPGFTIELVQQFTSEFLGSLKMRETSYFTQEEFFETLLYVAHLFLENLDIQSATLFLDFLRNRLTQQVIIKSDGSRINIQRTLMVRFFNTPALNRVFGEDLRMREQPENVIYCLEHYVRIEAPLNISPADSVVIELKTIDNLTPIGTATDSVIRALQNEESFSSDLIVENSQEISEFLSRPESLFYVGFVMQDTEGGHLTRLSPGIFTPYFFEQLISKQRGRIFVNQRSIFPVDHEVDRVHEMTKRWNDKLVVPEPVGYELSGKPIEDVYHILVQNKYRFSNLRDEEGFQENIDFRSSDTFQTIQSEKFVNFQTREIGLPQDNQDPYTDDLIEYAQERPYHILVHGKPKVGKTTFCHNLAKKLDLELIDVDIFVTEFLRRVAEGEENVQTDDETGQPIEFLKPWERAIITDLRRGERIKHDNLLELINDGIQRLRIDQKGCIMEIPCYDNPSLQMNYAELIRTKRLQINQQEITFNVIIELSVKDENLLGRTQQIKENSHKENFKLVTDAELLSPPEKVKKEGDDENDDADDEPLDPDDPRIIKEENLFSRINESDTMILRGLNNYMASVRPIIQEMEVNIHHLNNIFLDYDSLTVAQAVDTVYARLLPRSRFLRPVAASIEDAGEEDYANLPRNNINTEEGQLMRRWSLFYKHDPVALYQKKVQKGLSQFSCEYAGRIFCFANEQNKSLFLNDPKLYLREKPQLPRDYNIAIIGMKNTGKKTFAKKLSEMYGLEILDLPGLIYQRYEDQSKWDSHIPNNPETGRVHFSKVEFAEIKKGAPVDARMALPMLLHDRGVKLWKRLPPPKDPELLAEEERIRLEEEERQKEEAKKKKKVTGPKKEEKKEETKEVAPVIEDIPLLDLVPKPDEQGVIADLRGFIFIDFPTSEAHFNTMKELNINLDRLIILREPETNESGEPEEPGSFVTKRPDFYTNTTLTDEQTFLEAATAAIKGNFEEERLAEIPSGDIDQTFFRIRQFIDPFCLRIDDESTALPVDEGEGAEKILFGEFGPYCPVSVVEDNWLVLGKPELEVQIQGKRYRFYNEEVKKRFEDNLERYLSSKVLIEPPEPRIFITGVSGSGVVTNIERLHSRLRIPIVNFRQEFLKVKEFQRDQRKVTRRLLKGFNMGTDENEAIQEDQKEPEADPEIENDPDDFDVTKNEQEIANIVLGKLGAAIINCRLDPPPKIKGIVFEEEDEEELEEGQDGEAPPPKAKDDPKEDEPPEDLIKQPFVELLNETRKLPEILIILLVSEQEMLKRKFRQKVIQDEWDMRMQIISNKKEKARSRRLREMEKERKLRKEENPDEEIDMDAPLEIDPDQLDGIYQAANIPEEPDLAKMIEDEKERLLNQLKDERTKLEELAEAMQGQNINVLMFEANKDKEKVFKRISEELRKILEDREALFARHRVIKVEETETLSNDKVLEWILKSYTSKESRFGQCNPIAPYKATQPTSYPIIYENRIYYLLSEEERELSSRNPLKYLQDYPVPPKDIPLRPKVILLGKYKSGKTTVARKASQELGLVHVTIPEVQETIAKNKYYGKGKELFDLMATGQCPSDELLVDILFLRLQFSDVIQKGYILEGFPKTRRQALLMYEKRIMPDFVMTMNVEDHVIKARAREARSLGQDLFEYDEEIVDLRLREEAEEILAVENLYTYNFGNIRRFTKESTDSQVLELTEVIEEYTRGRQAAAIGINSNQPFEATHLSIKRSTIMSLICSSLTFSAVSLRKMGALEQMFLRMDPLVYHQENFYLLKDHDQVRSFIQNTQAFINVPLPVDRVARLPSPFEIIDRPVELRQYCPVELLMKRLVKGKRHLSLMAFGRIFSFSSLKAMRTFFKNPAAFQTARLPDKIKITPAASKELGKQNLERGDLQTYIHNELSKLIVKALNQASKFRLKYPTLTVHSTAIKLVALCLKASNPQQTEEIRQKYKDKMKKFIADCMLAQQIEEEYQRRIRVDENGDPYERSHFNEEHFLRLTEEFQELMKRVALRNPHDYFVQFIR